VNITTPYIVAEISCNHSGSLDKAFALIDEARFAGADAVKFQAFRPEDITIDSDNMEFICQTPPWQNMKLFDIYREAYTPREWFPDIFDYARNAGVEVFASVFSIENIEFLESLDCSMYKISAMEANWDELTEAAIATGKPVLISTNQKYPVDVSDKVRRNSNVKLLHCPAGYHLQDMDLTRFDEADGFSDHTGRAVSAACVQAYMACMWNRPMIVESHLTLYKDEGLDADFSLDPEEFRLMAHLVDEAWECFRSKEIQEYDQRLLHRSIFVVEDVKAGEVFTEANIRVIRPSDGLEPKLYQGLLGKTATMDIPRGTPLKPEHLF